MIWVLQTRSLIGHSYFIKFLSLVYWAHHFNKCGAAIISRLKIDENTSEKNLIIHFHYKYFVTIIVKNLHAINELSTQGFINLSSQEDLDWLSFIHNRWQTEQQIWSCHLKHMSPALSPEKSFIEMWKCFINFTVLLHTRLFLKSLKFLLH